MNGRSQQLRNLCIVAALLAAILALAGWLRFAGLEWDERQHLHPDERFLMMVVCSLERPASLAEYFDSARSPLNPRNKGFNTFVYGTLPTTMLHTAGAVTGRPGYGDLLLVGRTLSAAADLCTVAVCFLLGWLVTRRREGGLMAAALYGLAVLPIQHAHFFVVDPFATLFVTSSLAVLVWCQHRPSFYKWLLAGALWGAAMACKLSVYTFAVIPISLAIWQACEPGRGLRREGESRLAAIERALVRAGSFGLAGFVIMRLAMPDAFRGPGILGIIPEDRWLASINEARRLMSGAIDFPPGHQWTNRARFWFPWSNMVLWGMGLTFGLAAWAGCVGAAMKLLRGKHDRLLLVTLWAGLLFIHQGGQWVMSLRYFLPIYPALAALAAWGLLELLHAEVPRGRRRLGYALAAIVLGGALLWALAFTAIYRAPHPRIEASRWMLANIPPGAAIGNEVWDDALPLRVDGTDPYGNLYRGVDMHWYAEDDAGKLEQSLQWLDAADYIVLSSNRLYDSIPRLWMRYPMTTRYYEMLFSGELGFEPLAEFHSYPRLMGVEIPDTRAEEAFSVYDHPRVQIFRKSPAYDRESAKRHFEAALKTEPLRLSPLQESRAPQGLRFTAGEWDYKNRNVQAIPIKGDENDVGAALRYFLWLYLLGLLAAPILFVVARELPDRGLGLARPIGMALVAWASWLMASLHISAFSSSAIIGCVVALSIGSFALFWMTRLEWREFLRERWRLVLAGEVVFWFAFFAMAILRWTNPDLWHPSLGGEKPMDMAYLNAVMRTPDFPPHAPWHAGSSMNYYYIGYVLAAVPMKLSGVATEVGYNLAIAGFFALFASAVFGVGVSLAGAAAGRKRQMIAGLAAVVAAAIAGNWAQLKVVWENIAQGNARLESWFWDASRVISHPPTEAGPITEFPWFTFLFADLHAHLMALPFFAVLIGLTMAIFGASKNRAGLAALAALALGTCWVVNPWDLPTGAAILLFAFVFPRIKDGRRAIITSFVMWLVVLIAARLLFWPFHARYGSAYGSFELWEGSRTSIGEYISMFGAFLVVALAGLAAACRSSSPMRREWRIYIAGGAVALMLAVVGHWLPAVLTMTLVFTIVIILRRASSDHLIMPLLFTAIAIGIGAMVEMIVLRGDISRMNTVFKFFLQAWVLFALAGAAFIVMIDECLKGAARIAWRAGVMMLGASVLVYPMTATTARISLRMGPDAPRTLDGLAFMINGVLEVNDTPILLRDDLAGIRWLRGNAAGLPVIAEANTHPQLYGWGSRFSIHTGLPTIVGWDWHQRQQFAALPVDVVNPRIEEVKKLYNTPEAMEAWRLLDRYNAEFVIVGGLERALFDKAGIEKFAYGDGKWWTKVFESGALVIYRVADRPPRGK